ncbi:hypothetical protein [Nostoc piscinale]|uniref:hypothetical protein n=1 Tax=Nostoc piscinale TaxID=224012 RepID=UPI0039A5B285
MVRRFLVTAALLVTGTLLAAPRAFAETQNVSASGTIAPTCVFGSATAGTLGVAGANSTSISTANGSTGSTSVTCNYAAKLSISAPTQSGSDTVALGSATKTSTLTATSTSLTSGNTTTNAGTPVTLATGEATNISIGMNVSNGSTIIPASTYNYTVTLTVAP